VRSIVVPTTLVAFVFHLLVGCCAHHAHSHDLPVRAVVPQTAEVDRAGGCCHEDGDGHATPADSTPCDAPSEKKCDVDPCTYIVGSKVLTPQCEQAFAGLCSLVSCSMLPPALVFSTGHPDDWLETGLPCRVHLLHGVFLI
jgi:hypothetical protein